MTKIRSCRFSWFGLFIGEEGLWSILPLWWGPLSACFYGGAGSRHTMTPPPCTDVSGQLF